MTNIVWTQSALQTLELVYLQTLQYTKNERIAAKLHNKLIKEAEMLRTFPNAGNILNTSERVTLCYRALVVDTNYKLIYYVDANKDVIIVTVWDVRQNPDKLTKTIEKLETKKSSMSTLYLYLQTFFISVSN